MRWDHLSLVVLRACDETPLVPSRRAVVELVFALSSQNKNTPMTLNFGCWSVRPLRGRHCLVGVSSAAEKLTRGNERRLTRRMSCYLFPTELKHTIIPRIFYFLPLMSKTHRGRSWLTPVTFELIVERKGDYTHVRTMPHIET